MGGMRKHGTPCCRRVPAPVGLQLSPVERKKGLGRLPPTAPRTSLYGIYPLLPRTSAAHTWGHIRITRLIPT